MAVVEGTCAGNYHVGYDKEKGNLHLRPVKRVASLNGLAVSKDDGVIDGPRVSFVPLGNNFVSRLWAGGLGRQQLPWSP